MKQALKATSRYLRLVSNWPPRPIRDRKSHQAALKVLEQLASSDMSNEELDYFEVVSILVESYERKILEPDSQAEPREILIFLMEENGLRQTDLVSIVGSRSHLSEFLGGKRNLSKSAAAKLGARFKVRPEIFLPRIPS